MNTMRPILHRYEDPLARIWINCAEQIGFKVVRSPDVYASTDGQGTLLIAEDAQLDPDDSLAQMILHELCHALVEGEARQRQLDWGLGIDGGGNPWREHACLRLQALLAERFGLRDFLAPTTDYRVSFWNQLPSDPLWASPESGGQREKSCVAARLGFQRAMQTRWRVPMEKAFNTTVLIAEWIRFRNRDENQKETTAMPSLWDTVKKTPEKHPMGLVMERDGSTSLRCADCAWFYISRNRGRCKRSRYTGLNMDMKACQLFEAATQLNCQTCGACCREAYHSVEIMPREAVVKLHPEWVIRTETHLKLKREGSRCAALQGGNTPTETYACTIYPDRPKTCQQFTMGSCHCLEARQRVGLSL